MKSDMHLSRRQFIRQTAGTAAVLSFPTIIPASALGKDGRPAPSERIVMGSIGYGTIAFSTTGNFLSNPKVQMVAVADPARSVLQGGAPQQAVPDSVRPAGQQVAR